MASKSFSGGEALEAKLKELSEKISKAAQVTAGFYAGATEASGQPVALIAMVHEFGSTDKGIPPRPFFRPMIAEHGPEWGEQLGNILKANHFDTDISLGQMGELISGQLQDSIGDLREPPLKQATIDRKGFEKPLVDTGVMWQSVSYQVDAKEVHPINPTGQPPR